MLKKIIGIILIFIISLAATLFILFNYDPGQVSMIVKILLMLFLFNSIWLGLCLVMMVAEAIHKRNAQAVFERLVQSALLSVFIIMFFALRVLRVYNHTYLMISLILLVIAYFYVSRSFAKKIKIKTWT